MSSRRTLSKVLFNAVQPLRLDPVRRVVGALRFHYYVHLRKRLRTVDSEQSYAATVSHNMRTLSNFGGRRMDRLIKPLSVIETLGEDSTILTIGPRNESELLSLIGHGFKAKNIRGLDLITYSPMVDLGDMHDMPYPDDTFDVVLLGWVIAYSRDPATLVAETLRVAKPGAVIGVGLDYSTLGYDDCVKLSGYSVVDEDKIAERITSVAEILSLYGEHVDHVYFSHDAPLKISHDATGLNPAVSSIAVLFSITK